MFVGAARTVLTMPPSASRPMSTMSSCGTTPGCLLKIQVEKGTSILVLAPLHLRLWEPLRWPSVFSDKSPRVEDSYLFVVESVDEKERGAQSNDALPSQSFSAGHTELKQVTLEHSPPDPAEKPLLNSKEPRAQDVDRQGIRSCAAPCPATEIDAALQSLQSGAISTPAQDVPPSAAASRTHRRYLEDPSKAQACPVSSGLMQGCRRRELVYGALNSACATQDVQPHLRVPFATTTSCQSWSLTPHGRWPGRKQLV